MGHAGIFSKLSLVFLIWILTLSLILELKLKCCCYWWDNLVLCTDMFKLIACYKDLPFQYYHLKDLISLPARLHFKPTRQAARAQDVLVCCNWQIGCTCPAIPIACQTGNCIKIGELSERAVSRWIQWFMNARCIMQCVYYSVELL